MINLSVSGLMFHDILGGCVEDDTVIGKGFSFNWYTEDDCGYCLVYFDDKDKTFVIDSDDEPVEKVIQLFAKLINSAEDKHIDTPSEMRLIGKLSISDLTHVGFDNIWMPNNTTQGGFNICWATEEGFGNFLFFTDKQGKLYVDGEDMSWEFCHFVVSEAVKKLFFA